MALTIHRMNGDEGQVELTGLKAVVGVLYKWSLERREGNSSGGLPSWTLRASLSYQKETLLPNPKYSKQVLLKLPSLSEPNKWYLATPEPDAPMKVEDGRLTIEGVTLCPADPPK